MVCVWRIGEKGAGECLQLREVAERARDCRSWACFIAGEERLDVATTMTKLKQRVALYGVKRKDAVN